MTSRFAVYIILSVCLLFHSTIAHSQAKDAQLSSANRQLSLSLEPIANAKIYEIEFINKTSQRKKIFKSKDSEWSGFLPVGFYQLRTRSKDHRGVPGEWSSWTDLKVPLSKVEWVSNLKQDKIFTKQLKTYNIYLEWKSVPGANSYSIKIQNLESQKNIHHKIISQTQGSFRLDVGYPYHIQVEALNREGVSSEQSAEQSFVLIGGSADPLKWNKPNSTFVRQLSWIPVELAQTYELKLFRWQPTQKKWSPVHQEQLIESKEWAFPHHWPGGRYKAELQYFRKNFEPSQKTKLLFQVQDGDRSPAAEMAVIKKRSEEKWRGWYGIASYLITMLDYSSVHLESNAKPSTQMVGGTGRLGVGYLGSRWGFLGIADLSGFTLEGKNYTYASAETSAVLRLPVASKHEVRLLAGPYYKELPALTFSRSIGVNEDWRNVSYDMSLVQVAGSHLGAEYWYSFSKRLGLQLNAHMYTPMTTLKSPNGQNVASDQTVQYGLLGSYKISERFTGLLGYARREDIISYNAVSSSNNFVQTGQSNSINIKGHYLNLFAEWSF